MGAGLNAGGAPRRCAWTGEAGATDPAYLEYHDKEWGRFVRSERALFEFIVLESAQAGLSWRTILRRREGYRRAFADFDFERVAAFTESDALRLMQDAGIIRNRLKILAAISAARLFMEIRRERGSFGAYLLSFFPDGKPLVNRWRTQGEVPASTPLSDALSVDMKKRGFKFFGTTICYAFLQAVGYVDDHLQDCDFKPRTHHENPLP